MRAVQALRSAPLRSECEPWPPCGHRDQKKDPAPPSDRVSEHVWEPSGRVPELKGDPVQPAVAPPPGLVGGASCTTGATMHQRGNNQ